MRALRANHARTMFAAQCMQPKGVQRCGIVQATSSAA
jgi:hypothetical protein